MANLNYYEAVIKINGNMTRTSTNATSASEAKKLLESMYGRGTVVGGPTKK